MSPKLQYKKKFFAKLTPQTQPVISVGNVQETPLLWAVYSIRDQCVFLHHSLTKRLCGRPGSKELLPGYVSSRDLWARSHESGTW
jgi:hypothetical protein